MLLIIVIKKIQESCVHLFLINLSVNYFQSKKSFSQKFLDHAKQSATEAFKTISKRLIQKTVETTGDLIGNKISDKITRVSKSSPKNNSETNEEILGERYISPKLRQIIIGELRLTED